MQMKWWATLVIESFPLNAVLPLYAAGREYRLSVFC